MSISVPVESIVGRMLEIKQFVGLHAKRMIPLAFSADTTLTGTNNAVI